MVPTGALIFLNLGSGYRPSGAGFVNVPVDLPGTTNLPADVHNREKYRRFAALFHPVYSCVASLNAMATRPEGLDRFYSVIPAGFRKDASARNVGAA